jgi:hypothetical protein
LRDVLVSEPFVIDEAVCTPRQSDTEMKRTLARQDQPDFIADFYFMNKTTRCMPVYSIPGLIDHH